MEQLSADTGCDLEDLPGAMDDKDGWWERVREIRASSLTWLWWRIKHSLSIHSHMNTFTCMHTFKNLQTDKQGDIQTKGDTYTSLSLSLSLSLYQYIYIYIYWIFCKISGGCPPSINCQQIFMDFPISRLANERRLKDKR